MKKLILRFFAFLLFNVMMYCAFLLVWGATLSTRIKSNLIYKQGSDGYLYTRVREIQNFKNIDILFIGSSLTYRGYDPRIFKEYGITIFNLGSSAQTPIQTNLLLKKYLGQLNPKLIIIEASPGIFQSEGVESSLDLITNGTWSSEYFNMALKVNNPKVYNTLLYSILRKPFINENNFKENKTTDLDRYISGGYVARKIRYNTCRKYPSKKFNLNSSQIDSFKETIDLIKSQNKKYVLVFPTITTCLYNSYQEIKEFDHLMSSIGPYYNYNTKLRLDDSLCFYDSHHLNQNGVEKYNRNLIEHLINNELITKNK